MLLLIIAMIIGVVGMSFNRYLSVAYTSDWRIATFARQVSVLLVLGSWALLFIVDWKIGLLGIVGSFVGFCLFYYYWHQTLRAGLTYLSQDDIDDMLHDRHENE